MGGDYILLEQHQQLGDTTLFPGGSCGSSGAGGQVSRATRRRLSSFQQLLLILVAGSCTIALYAYWDVMLLTSGNVPETQLSNETLAEKLQREVRVLCWVLTTPKYHKSRAVHVMRTWGKRCNKIYFMTSEPDDELPTIVLTKPDKYEVLWGKTKEAFSYLYEHMLDEADWFMKADDDTYVFVENLRYMLYPYSPDQAIYFGYNFKMVGTHQKNESYMSGGSGYVLSREALRVFVEGLNDTTKCRQEDDHAEDMEMGRCLFNLDVKAGDSRDSKLRHRFYPLLPFNILLSGYFGLDFWLYKYAFYSMRSCMDCLSEYPVAFHYVSPAQLYVFDFFNYDFQLMGKQKPVERLPEKIKPEDLVIPEYDNHFD
ncbi:glycoprotein-N-acetylgalactosamine 3-beta-galactosyltransferase 1 [Drosophila guanche]|uniref:N-acetylgalactosaminide beta-1,3-galactosyltransferase n=1 Tax=Drosophila guanche TaxID=7266 RepID=A0A3B0KRS8_DROGU|nr:glycoprotein-N-acetylgalactosamine 3-beta-galactosyltransferase 1 [Drosophila guanche]SPP86628.1 blast:Glycoprotein-N-acetylgalactosamine 3-beta-galactosyltransferase 1 [Drosophila guanche]